MKKKYRRQISLVLALVMLTVLSPVPVRAQENVADEDGWVNFLLICNEGMSNRGGNVGNTCMAVAMNENTGKIRLMMFTWDTFVKYEGYDIPQKLDMAYRNNGPEETVKVFNQNFDMGIELFMSLNYLNLATLIDDYGGVTVDVSRAERNALNSMVASKKENIQALQDANLLDQLMVELLAKEYYLSEFGPDTHLNGLQAVGYGWLQYDSVYNCCIREVEVIANLFRSVSSTLADEVVLYTDEVEKPDIHDSRRVVNLDHLTEEDLEFMNTAISPIFETSYNNLTENVIISIALAFARISFLASKQGVDIMDQLEYKVLPLEAQQPYDNVAGTEGHLIDYEANSKAMKEFLYRE
ncbi:MAG: LCP family protein [Blautia sp.]|nr:LCP family protein [Blautia sp.]